MITKDQKRIDFLEQMLLTRYISLKNDNFDEKKVKDFTLFTCKAQHIEGNNLRKMIDEAMERELQSMNEIMAERYGR